MKNKILKFGTIGVLAPIMATGMVFADETNVDYTVNKDIEIKNIGSVGTKTGIVKVKSGSNLNIRASYTTNSKIVGKIPAGKSVSILGETNGWYKVRYNGIEGYSSSEYINLNGVSQNVSGVEQSVSGNGKVVNISTRLNVRSQATTSSSVVGKLTNGQVVRLMSKTISGWYKIEFSNKIGYVYGEYISEISTQGGNITSSSNVGKIATVTASALNVRSGAGTNYPVISKAYRNNNVKVLDVNSNGWNKVQLTSGVTGWVSGDYLTNYREGSLNAPVQNQPQDSNSNVSSNEAINKVINIVKSKLGCAYEWGAEGPNTFDCSGLMYYAFKNGAGITLPRTSSSQATAGYAVSRSQLKPGDLVFFNTSGKGISHVGIYIGNNEMIHSTKPGDVVKKTNINSNYYSSRFVTARRVIG